MYLTAWNRYIADPWQSWKNYFASTKSWKGWHTCVVSCTDGVNVKYWIDGQYFGALSVTDNDGTSVYPRNPMQVAFANWIWNNVIGSSTENRTTTMKVDWTIFFKDEEKVPTQIDSIVADFRCKGITRRNLTGQVEQSNVTCNSTPYLGVPAEIPGTVECEKYDQGGEGIAYHEINPLREGANITYRPNDGVDIEVCSEGGYQIGYFEPGEWLKYNVNCTKTDKYQINFRLATNLSTVKFYLELDGANITGSINPVSTGGWNNWTIYSVSDIDITAGTHVLRLVMEEGSANFNYINFQTQSTSSGIGVTSIANSCYEINGLYVDGFTSILGNINKEDSVLKFAFNNGFNYLILYDLNTILPNSSKVAQLAHFIERAKTKYLIDEIAGAVENAHVGNLIVNYNLNHSSEERIDVINLEFEFWSSNLLGLGYCNYLTNYGPCDRENAFLFYVDQLKRLDSITDANQMKLEVYIGWTNEEKFYK